MQQVERFSIPAAELAADNNIRHQYPIHRGKWIVHPDISAKENSFCRYELAFELDAEATFDIHVSADNRFELRCDGQYVGMGPDRSDLEHWSFHCYRMTLAKGPHTLSAEVHYLGEGPAKRPYAQTFIEPAFVLYSPDAPVDLNTGSAAWKATRLAGVSTDPTRLNTFCVVGSQYTIDAAAYFAPPPAVDVKVLQDAGRNIQSGSVLPGWKLYPSRMPEQVRRPVGGGCIRYVGNIGDADPFGDDSETPDSAWQAFVEGKAPLTVGANTRTTVLWDLCEYHTAYPELTTSGGAGASVNIEWAESCYETLEPREGERRSHKGNRDEVAGKYFLGFGDTFLPDGPQRTFRPFWWRAGRYIRLRIQTADAPLVLERLVLQETRMPLENESQFSCSEAGFARVVDVSARGIQMCAHETYMDCPYYEQMMYVGDTRVQMLTAYVMSGEDRLNQRALEIFDWSRRENGFVLERCPSIPKQLSTTFSMIWVMMLRDFGWWRSEPAFMARRIKGMRCLLEEFKAVQGRKDLLPALPGWSFMDWVEGLSFVNNPGPDESVSSVVNLLFVNALNAAAEVEDAFGEPHLAQYDRDGAARLAGHVAETFWDERRGLFADDPQHTQYSEHAQCLALLSGHFPDRAQRCFESLITADGLLRTTVYFSFYLLETFARFGRGDLILQKLDFWKQMAALGFKTPAEMPEPSRSDCHGWGSHPLFHMHASLAGIRPAGPGFASVLIEPRPGSLTEIRSTIPHPAGQVSLRMTREGAVWKANVSLPAGVDGTLRWLGAEHKIEGAVDLDLPLA